jgi:membrane protein required for colicin V production
MQSFLHSAQVSLSGMNPLDWAIALVLTISTVTAFMRGLIRSLISLLGIIVGIAVACIYTPQAGTWLLRWIKPLALSEVVAFVCILAGVYLAFALVGRVLKGAFSAIGLGFFDRLGGAIFGFVRGVLLIAALLLPAAPWFAQFSAAKSSVLLPYLLPASHGISFVMPRDFAMRVSMQRWLNHANAALHEIAPAEARKTSSE